MRHRNADSSIAGRLVASALARFPASIGARMTHTLNSRTASSTLLATRFRLAAQVLSIAGLGWISGAIAAPVYSVLDLGALSDSGSQALGLSGNGQVVGFSNIPTSVATLFNTAGGASTYLPCSGGGYCVANSVNNSGQVVGAEAGTNMPNFHATLFSSSGGTNVDMGVLAGYDRSQALAVNDLGQAVGYSKWVTPRPHSEGWRATFFSTSGGAPIDLGTLSGTGHSRASDINNSGQIAGISTTADNRYLHAALFSASGGATLDLGTLGGTGSEAYGINDRGQAVGWATTTNDRDTHATLFSTTGGANVDLGTLDGGTSSAAIGINDRGQVVGYSSRPTDMDAFLWESGVMTSLDLLIDPTLGWHLPYVNDINNLGQIAGAGIDRSGKWHALLLIPVDTGQVPEPTTLALVGAALLGVASTRWRGATIPRLGS